MTTSDKLREMNSKSALREIAEKYKNGGYRIVNDYAGNKTMQRYDNKDELLSDLTALISEGYYPKEFVEWKDINCTYLRGSSRYAINECPKTAFGDYVPYTLDELFNYWKENEQ